MNRYIILENPDTISNNLKFNDNLKGHQTKFVRFGKQLERLDDLQFINIDPDDHTAYIVSFKNSKNEYLIPFAYAKQLINMTMGITFQMGDYPSEEPQSWGVPTPSANMATGRMV